jgi:RND family efflux transporter MFP subunit
VVGQRFVDPGATLAANSPVVSVLDLAPVVAVVNVAERDYVRLRPGQQATVTTAAYPDRQFPAEVARIAPRLDEASRQARVELTVDNDERLLRPGMFVTVGIVLERIPEATVVPQVALAEREGRTGVFLADAAGARVRFVPVRTGVVDDGRVQIMEPALQGRVVTLGQHLLRDGAPIRPVEPDRAAEGGRRAR